MTERPGVKLDPDANGHSELAILLRLLIIVCLVVVAWMALRSWWTRQRPPATGLQFGQLRALDEDLGGVGSWEPLPGAQVDPLPYVGSREHTEARLEQVLGAIPKVRLETRDGDYWHVSFAFGPFHNLDDLELLFKDVGERVEVRAACRVGGGQRRNRERIEAIRSALTAA